MTTKKVQATLVCSKEDWVWMPHPGHFICAFDCRFHLTTWVGNYIVSTVGEHFPDSAVRDIIAESRGIKIEGKGDERKADYMKKIGFDTIGYDRKYETMVFAAFRSKEKCCPYEQRTGEDLDFRGYNDAGEATKGHMALCRKWSKKPPGIKNKY